MMPSNATLEFEAFPKIPRLYRQCVITEKLDGTNACILIDDDGEIKAASRSRLITPQADNYGFAKWVEEHKTELSLLGPGRHFGEWWGLGIQRTYGLPAKRFSLFNSDRWNQETKPDCCYVVPVLYAGLFSTDAVKQSLEVLREEGSQAAPGFMKAEGLVVYHVAAAQYFKTTLDKDEHWKERIA